MSSHTVTQMSRSCSQLVLRDRDPVEDLNALANAIAESPAELFNWNGGLS